MPTLSVGDPIGLALARTGDLLFRPFRFKKWLAIAVIAMLALAGEGGGSFPNNFSGSGRGGAGPPGPADIRAFVHTHFEMVVLVGVIGFLLIYALYFLLRWLNSRAQFMFFDAIVLNSDEIARPWRDHCSLGNSLFFFRILWDHFCFAITFVIVAFAAMLAWPDLSHYWIVGTYDFTGASTDAIVFFVLIMLLFMPILWILSSIIFDMALPVMYVRQMRAWQAVKTTWRELFLPNFWTCILYFLFFVVIRIVEGLWAFIGMLLVLLLTCCTAIVILFIPVIGMYPVALVCLPVLAFERAYKLYFISQFGDDYRINWVFTHGGGFPVVLDSQAPHPPGHDPDSPFP